ncbi:hypothetical protein HK102_000460 [Quaeritorhiza haematococci]|nr:hypothetical protein HK102_000460 [Quaeritorhiza haematococci]
MPSYPGSSLSIALALLAVAIFLNNISSGFALPRLHHISDVSFTPSQMFAVEVSEPGVPTSSNLHEETLAVVESMNQRSSDANGSDGGTENGELVRRTLFFPKSMESIAITVGRKLGNLAKSFDLNLAYALALGALLLTQAAPHELAGNPVPVKFDVRVMREAVAARMLPRRFEAELKDGTRLMRVLGEVWGIVRRDYAVLKDDYEMFVDRVGVQMVHIYEGVEIDDQEQNTVCNVCSIM